MKTRLAFIVIASFVAGAIGAIAAVVDRDDVGAPAVVVEDGKPDIGGAFSLVSHEGRRITESNLRGRYTLMMFGFTNCPDICPAELQTVMSALGKLGPKADRITPVFVTLDPERDTVQTMGRYVSHFGKKLVGLTGTKAEIDRAAKAYKVYHMKVPDKDGAGYSIDHSAIAYLMGPNGQYLAHFPYGTSADAMSSGIARHMGPNRGRLAKSITD